MKLKIMLNKYNQEEKMTIRHAKEINPTMKIDSTGTENAIDFREIQVVILAVEDVETIHGKKVKVVVENKAEDLNFDVFLNNFSMQNLITIHGDDDIKWIGKVVDLKKETDTKYKKDMIVLLVIVDMNMAWSPLS